MNILEILYGYISQLVRTNLIHFKDWIAISIITIFFLFTFNYDGKKVERVFFVVPFEFLN